MSGSTSRGEKDALHGAALRGVDEYGEAIDCAELRAGLRGDCGMRSLGVALADRSAGLMKGEGGIVTCGDCGRVLGVPALMELTLDTPLWQLEVDVIDALES